MHNTIEEFGRILKAYFSTLPDKFLTTLLLIRQAVFLGADNIYQVLQVLGLPKTALLKSCQRGKRLLFLLLSAFITCIVWLFLCC